MRLSVGICALVLGCGAATDADIGAELPTTDETERLRAELEEARAEMDRLRAEAEEAKAQETEAEPQESAPPPTREPEAQSKPEMAPPLAEPEPAAQPEEAPAPEPQGEQPEPPPEPEPLPEVEVEIAPPLSAPPPEPEPLPPAVCGDGIVSGDEVCDDGTFRAPWPGGCNQLCTAVYQEKRIREVIAGGPAFGGVAGADSICQAEWGENWKALVVGEGRVASATPFLGDGQLDWVLHSWTIYVDDSWRPQVPDILNPGNTYSSVVWVTNSIALLGVRDGTEREYHPPEIDNSRIQGETHWAGYRADWTTGETCGDWTIQDGRVTHRGTTPFWSPSRQEWRTFDGACFAGPTYLRCVEQ